MSEDVARILRGVSSKALYYWAEEKHIRIPDNASKEELVSAIIEHSSEDLGDVLRGVIHLELVHSNEEMTQKLETSLAERIAGAMKVINTVKWTLLSIISAISLILALGAAFSIWKISQLDSLKGEFELLVDAENGAVAALRKHVLSTLVRDLDSALRQMSITFVAASERGSLDSSRLALEELSKIHRAPALTSLLEKSQFLKQEQEMLAFLEQVVERLKKLEEIADSRGDRLLKLLTEAYDDWNSLSTEVEFKDAGFNSFVQRFQAYRLNVLGMIELKRYRDPIAPAPDRLNNAREFFQAAIEANKNFARAYANMAIIKLYEFENAKKNQATSQVLTEILTEGEDLLRSALTSEISERLRSTILNNLAHFQLVRAEFYRETGIEEPKKALTEGRRFLKRARNLPQRAEVVFVTAAEIECELLAEQSREVSRWKPSRKEEKLEEILDLVRTAIDQGYKGYSTLTQDAFFMKKRFYRHLGLLGRPDWEQRTLRAAGVPAE